jgi:hypothetical protein
MRAGIEDICEVLDLGAACDPPELVTGGSSAARWRVRTTRGRWLVKTSAPAAWQLREMRVSGRLERAAYEAGVPMPTPGRVQAFAGLVRATLGTLAYELWLAAGHRTATADRQASAVQSVRRLAARLPVILDSLDSWSRLIR